MYTAHILNGSLLPSASPTQSSAHIHCTQHLLAMSHLISNTNELLLRCLRTVSYAVTHSLPYGRTYETKDLHTIALLANTYAKQLSKRQQAVSRTLTHFQTSGLDDAGAYDATIL